MLNKDIRNNSVWNHRYYLVTRGQSDVNTISNTILDREIQMATERVTSLPSCESGWNYIKG